MPPHIQYTHSLIVELFSHLYPTVTHKSNAVSKWLSSCLIYVQSLRNWMFFCQKRMKRKSVNIFFKNWFYMFSTCNVPIVLSKYITSSFQFLFCWALWTSCSEFEKIRFCSKFERTCISKSCSYFSGPPDFLKVAPKRLVKWRLLYYRIGVNTTAPF